MIRLALLTTALILMVASVSYAQNVGDIGDCATSNDPMGCMFAASGGGGAPATCGGCGGDGGGGDGPSGCQFGGGGGYYGMPYLLAVVVLRRWVGRWV